MELLSHSFINLVFIGIIALFPVVNPVGSSFIISPFLQNLSHQERRKAVGKITFYAFLICVVSLFAGHWILELFGISIPVVQLAGGIMICKMGWEFLSAEQKNTNISEGSAALKKATGYDNIADKLFYPITFPVTTGAGTMSVLFTLSARRMDKDQTDYYLNIMAILLAIVIMCVLIYIFYLNAERIIHYLGTNGENIVNRISAFLIFCVGLQIALTGLKTLFNI